MTQTSLVGTRDRAGVAWALLAARVILGIIFLAHGAQLLFGAFGGPGLAGAMGSKGPGGGGIVGLLVAIGQFFGGLGVLFGFLSRFSAASLIVIMIGAIVLVHAKNGFFASANGFEFNLALIGLSLVILLAGPGPFSMVRALLKRVPPAIE
jgi:putative oxidoreductase